MSGSKAVQIAPPRVHPEARNLPLLAWSHHIFLEINFKIRRTDLQPDHSSVPLIRHLLLPNAS